MLGPTCADKCRRDPGRRTRKLKRALKVILQSKGCRYKRRETAGELSLKQSGAGDDGDAERTRRLKSGTLAPIHRLIHERERFRHRKIEWQLYKSEVMPVPRDGPRHRENFFER